MTLDFSVLITNRNEGETLRRTVDDVFRHAPEGRTEVVVVDDASADGSARFLVEEGYSAPFVRLVRNEDRKGLIQSRALAADVARGRFLHFLDAHCAVEPRWLEKLTSCLNRIDHKGIAVPLIQGLDSNGWHIDRESAETSGCTIVNPVLDFAWSDPLKVDGMLSTCTIGGLGWACSREWYEHIGGLDRGMATWGGENIDIPLRTWIAGGHCLVADDVRIGHLYRKADEWVPLEDQHRANVEYTFNKIRAAHTVFTRETFTRILENLSCLRGFEEAFRRLWEDPEPLARLKGHLEAVRCRPESWILETFRLPLFEPPFYYRRPRPPGRPEHPPRPRVSVILIAPSAEPSRTAEILHVVRKKTTYGNYDVVLVQSGEGMESPGEADGGRVRSLVTPVGVDRAMAINLGAQFSDADFVAVVDGRTVSVDEHWIERFLLLFEEGPRRLLACPRTVEFDDTGEKKAFFDLTWNWDAPGLALTRFEPPREGPFAAVSCPDTVIFFKRRRFLDLGGLDPHLPDLTDGWRDLSIRAWLSGDEVVCHPGILVERKRAAGVAATSLGAWLTTRKCFTDERRLAACEKAVATTLRPRGLFRHIEDERKLFLERARFDDDWLFYKFGIGGPPDGS